MSSSTGWQTEPSVLYLARMLSYFSGVCAKRQACDPYIQFQVRHLHLLVASAKEIPVLTFFLFKINFLLCFQKCNSICQAWQNAIYVLQIWSKHAHIDVEDFLLAGVKSVSQENFGPRSPRARMTQRDLWRKREGLLSREKGLTKTSLCQWAMDWCDPSSYTTSSAVLDTQSCTDGTLAFVGFCTANSIFEFQDPNFICSLFLIQWWCVGHHEESSVQLMRRFATRICNLMSTDSHHSWPYFHWWCIQWRTC